MTSRVVGLAADCAMQLRKSTTLSKLRVIAFLFPTLSMILQAAVAAESVSVDPPEFQIGRPRDRVQLVVRTTGAEQRDITREVRYSVDNPAIVTVSETGVVRPLASGSAVVTAGYGSDSATCRITVDGYAADQPVNFDHEVLPILSKSGCSGGSCHGAPHGKAGFRLSLFGGDPEFDRDALVREARSRRVSPLHPENSLLLLKPAMQVPHMGGRRFTENDLGYRLLHSWIADGCRVENEPLRCTGIDVLPGGHNILQLPNGARQLRVVARFQDGSAHDVTHLAKFESSDAAVAGVSRDGYVTGYARGDVAVIVRYLQQIETPLFTVVRRVPDFQWKPLPTWNYIDSHVDAKLRQMQYLPSEVCSDEVFLRRVFLDVIGILPTPEERQQFLSSTSADKRDQLIERLLSRPEYAAFWAQKWGDLLRLSRKQIGLTAVFKFSAWLQAAVAENMPYDEFARELITATGSTLRNPAGNYYRTSSDTNDAMETTAQLFLGTRIQCAKCHNHPFERWTQDNYYGLAAVFHRVGRKKTRHPDEVIVYDTATGEVDHPASGETLAPWVPADGALDVSGDEDRRAAFADWLTNDRNPYFASVEVNRIWAQVMGSGIVEPFDDFRDSNPPANPDLLRALAQDFRDSGYDRAHILRVILKSRTYQSTSLTNRSNRSDVRYFSHYRARRLTAEQLVDALTSVIGIPESFDSVPAGTKATWLPAPDLKPHNRAELGSVDFLKVFGQPERQSVCECERGDETSLGQALQLLNGEFLHRRLTSDSNRFRQMLQDGRPHAEIVRELYLRALCREPAPQELQAALSHIMSSDNKATAFEDVCWVIVNKDEFLFQH